MSITINTNIITAPVTLSPNVITAPITLGIPGPPGPSGIADSLTSVIFSAANLVVDGDFFNYVVTHDKNITYVPIHIVINNLGQTVNVPAVYIDANSFKFVFPTSIAGNWILTYL